MSILREVGGRAWNAVNVWFPVNETWDALTTPVGDEEDEEGLEDEFSNGQGQEDDE